MILSKDKINGSDQREAESEIGDILGNDIFISTGNIYEDPEGIHISFLEALTEIKYRLLNPNKEYKRENMDSEDEGYVQKISQYQTENFLILNRCLDTSNEGDVEKTVKEIELNFEEFPGQVGLMCCYDLVSRLLDEVKKRGMNLTEKELFALTSFKTIKEFIGNLNKILERLCNEIQRLKLETQTVLIKEIRDYVEDKYRDPALSLVEISDHFGYSPSHMSKMISQNMNQSFSEMVQEKRMNYTKDCLIHTNKTIAQIAQEAGYTNLSNFTRRFKNSENMTPGQYRNLYSPKEA